MDLDEIKQRVATACRVLADQGLADYRGHASARIPGTDRIVIRAHGGERGDLRHAVAADMAVVTQDGRWVEGVRRLPGELILHTSVYRARPDVQGVVHCHPRHVVVLSDLRQRILPMAAVSGPVAAAEIPVFPSSRLIKSDAQADEMATLLGAGRFCILRHHGIVAAAASLEQATIETIWLEEQARLTWMACCAGRPQGIGPDEIAAQEQERNPNWDERWRYYALRVG